MSRLLFASFLCSVAVALFGQAAFADPMPASILYSGYPDRGSVSRVYADGRVETIDLGITMARGGSITYGTDYPKPSPDGRYVAFVRHAEVWLMDLGSRKARPITQTAKERVKVSSIYLTSWSSDGMKLLFYVAAELPEDASRQQVVMDMISPALSKFRIYDLMTGRTETLSLPARFAVWLPDGDFLLIPDGQKAWQPILRWRPGSTSTSEFVGEKASYGQLVLSADGKTITGIAHFKHNTSEIVLIDAATGKLTRVIGPGGFAQYNWPSTSPAKKKLAYIERRGDKELLVSEGTPIPLQLGLWPSFGWINDETIVLRDNCSLTIVDVKTRRVVAEHPIKLHDETKRQTVCAAK